MDQQQIKDRITELEGQIAEAEEKAAPLKDEVNRMNAAIENVKGMHEEAAEEVRNLKAKLPDLVARAALQEDVQYELDSTLLLIQNQEQVSKLPAEKAVDLIRQRIPPLQGQVGAIASRTADARREIDLLSTALKVRESVDGGMNKGKINLTILKDRGEPNRERIWKMAA